MCDATVWCRAHGVDETQVIDRIRHEQDEDLLHHVDVASLLGGGQCGVWSEFTPGCHQGDGPHRGARSRSELPGTCWRSMPLGCLRPSVRLAPGPHIEERGNGVESD